MLFVLAAFLFLAPQQATEGGAGARLRDAAARGDVAAVKTALAQGAPVNAADADGRTALFLAAGRHASQDLLSVLLKAGADVNAADRDGNTPLHAAMYIANLPPDVSNVGVDQAEKETVPVVKILLDHGAKVDVANRKGTTPLMLAQQWGSHFGKPAIEQMMKQAAAKR